MLTFRVYKEILGENGAEITSPVLSRGVNEFGHKLALLSELHSILVIT